MEEKVDKLNLHSKEIIGKEALSHQKARLCSSSEEIKITMQKGVMLARF